jgi:hypothetical protein
VAGLVTAAGLVFAPSVAVPGGAGAAPTLVEVDRFGGAGEAPGQLAGPVALDVADDGTIWVAEQGVARYQAFDEDGTSLAVVPASRKPIDVAVGPDGIALGLSMRGGECCFLPSMPYPTSYRESVLQRFDRYDGALAAPNLGNRAYTHLTVDTDRTVYATQRADHRCTWVQGPPGQGQPSCASRGADQLDRWQGTAPLGGSRPGFWQVADRTADGLLALFPGHVRTSGDDGTAGPIVNVTEALDATVDGDTLWVARPGQLVHAEVDGTVLGTWDVPGIAAVALGPDGDLWAVVGREVVHWDTGTLPPPDPSAPTSPDAPTEVEATLDGDTATVTWSPPDDDGGADVEGYRVYRDGELLDEVDASTSSVVDDDLPPGTFHYAIAAVSAAGRGVTSAPVELEVLVDVREVSRWGTAGNAAGQLSDPRALDVGSDGTVWVAEAGMGRFQGFTSSGEAETVVPVTNDGWAAIDVAVAPDDTVAGVTSYHQGADCCSHAGHFSTPMRFTPGGEALDVFSTEGWFKHLVRVGFGGDVLHVTEDSDQLCERGPWGLACHGGGIPQVWRWHDGYVPQLPGAQQVHGDAGEHVLVGVGSELRRLDADGATVGLPITVDQPILDAAADGGDTYVAVDALGDQDAQVLRVGPDGEVDDAWEVRASSIAIGPDSDIWALEGTEVVRYDFAAAVPGVPRGGAGELDAEGVSLTWTPPADSGAPGISAYRVYRDDVQVAEVDGWSVAALDDAALAPGTYEYKVAAVNATGEGPRSAAVEVEVAGDPPDPWAPPDVASFSDVGTGHPFFSDVEWLVAEGIADGYPDDSFRPTAPVSRQAMAAFLHRLAGAPDHEATQAPFSDVGLSHPFVHEIDWLVSEGVASGFEDGTFRPSVAVSRAAMAAFLHRMAGSPVIAEPTTPPFTDVGLGHPFVHEIGWLTDAGIADGYQDGTYRPGDAVSRGAMAAFLHRLHDDPGVDLD